MASASHKLFPSGDPVDLHLVLTTDDDDGDDDIDYAAIFGNIAMAKVRIEKVG